MKVEMVEESLRISTFINPSQPTKKNNNEKNSHFR